MPDRSGGLAQFACLVAVLGVACAGRTEPSESMIEPARDDASTPGPCESDTDCGHSSRCLADHAQAGVDLVPMPLHCGQPSAAGRGAGSECASAGDCARGLCGLVGRCFAPCRDDGDCEPGERCGPVQIRSGPAALQPLRACYPVHPVASGVQVRTDARPGLLLGEGFERIPIGPVDSLATTVVLVGASLGAPFAWRLFSADPEPLTLFDFAAVTGSSAPPSNPLVPTARPITLLLPNGPEAVLSDSGYELEVETTAPADVTVQVLARRTPGRRLNVNLFYVGGGGYAPEGLRGPPALRDALWEVEDVLAETDLVLGRVRQFEVVGGLRSRYSLLSLPSGADPGEIGELFALSAGLREPAVNVFLVRLADGLVGFSGGIPGPPGLHGTEGSGLLISVDLLERTAELPADISLGQALAHEIGHYLGLFHTSEVRGQVVEALTDTPECRRDRDLNADGILSLTECASFGPENLMYWAASGRALSVQQTDVLEHALVLE